MLFVLFLLTALKFTFKKPDPALKQKIRSFEKERILYNHGLSARYHTLISTSTPEGSSNFIRASTVLEEEE